MNAFGNNKSPLLIHISDLLPLHYLYYDGERRRELQEIPDYTSPPLDDALEATPEAYRSDAVIDAARAAAASGNCTAEESSSITNRCHIPFVPPANKFDKEPSKVGVIFYGGALVDPRAYSPVVSILSTRYGLPVVVPIFDRDLAFTIGICESGRLDLAQAEFEYVEKWVLSGHSLGGLAAMADTWTYLNDTTTNKVAGLVMIAADINQDLCGAIDFTTSGLPMASVTGSLDMILNQTRSAFNRQFLSNETFFLDIYGGNHALFGSYDYSERTPLLGQVDGVALIPPQVQWDLTAASIYHVASRVGLDLPQPIQAEQECPPPTSAAAAATISSWMWMAYLLATWLCRRIY